MEQVNLNDRTTFYASEDLVKELKEKNPTQAITLNFAYTNYGGTIFDKLIIEYFEANHPEAIVSEPAIHEGKNAFIFGELATELNNATENYLLGFRDFEDFFIRREDEIKREGVQYFLSYIKDKYTLAANIEDEIMGNYYGGQVLTGGWDYSESELVQWCIDNNLLTDLNNVFTYIIDIDERGEFQAHVENSALEIVFTTMGPDIFEAGYMKHKNDMQGLHKYLVSLRIITEEQKLIL